MSLLIKGIDMPECCCDCKIFSGEGYLCPLHEDSAHWLETVRYKRVADCPLAAIPTPHGRLIDADAIMDLLEKSVPEKNRGHQFYVFRHMLRNAPTVIEAEE